MKKEEFVDIIRDHQKLIYKICYSYCLDPENRKDLEQEILLQLWKSMKKYDGRVKLSTWIYRIALNTAITCYRNECKHNSKKTKLDASVISLPDMDTDSERNEQIKLLYAFIEQLNEIDRALMLLYLDDNKQKDMAEILGISETNVATKINRIKKILKEKMSSNN